LLLKPGGKTIYIGPVGEQIRVPCDRIIDIQQPRQRLEKEQALAGDKAEWPGQSQKQEDWRRPSPTRDPLGQSVKQLPALLTQTWVVHRFLAYMLDVKLTDYTTHSLI
jgi:hypothetical protein